MPTSRRLTHVLIALALLLGACSRDESGKAEGKGASKAEAGKDAGKSEPQPADATTGTTGTTGTTTAEPEATTAADTTEEEEGGEPIPVPDSFAELGVAVCDQYVTDYQRCITDKVPEAERETHRRAIAENHAAWTQTKAGGDAATTALQIGCRAAREQAKEATTQFGCEW